MRCFASVCVVSYDFLVNSTCRVSDYSAKKISTRIWNFSFYSVWLKDYCHPVNKLKFLSRTVNKMSWSKFKCRKSKNSIMNVYMIRKATSTIISSLTRKYFWTKMYARKKIILISDLQTTVVHHHHQKHRPRASKQFVLRTG